MKTKNNIKKILINLVIICLSSAIIAGLVLCFKEKLLYKNKTLTSPNFNGAMCNITYQITQQMVVNDYILITNTTNLINGNTTLFELPKSYYCVYLGEQTINEKSYYKVNYNGYIGYALKECFDNKTTPTGNYQEKVLLNLYSGFQTYIRTSPNIQENKLYLLKESATVTYIGQIKGDVPSDGSSDVWYYVVADISDTKSITGYIYSELVANTSDIKEQNPNLNKQQSQETTQPITENNAIKEETTSEISLSVKIFLIVLFSILAIVLFILLIKRPKTNKIHANKTTFTDFPTDEDNTPEFLDITPIENPHKLQNTDTITPQIEQIPTGNYKKEPKSNLFYKFFKKLETEDDNDTIIRTENNYSFKPKRSLPINKKDYNTKINRNRIRNSSNFFELSCELSPGLPSQTSDYKNITYFNNTKSNKQQ